MTATEQLLNDHIHRLTREHRVTYTDPETGTTSYPTEMSLFDQLRLEQASGRRSTGGSGSGSRSPIAIQAMILWNEIREALNTRHIQHTAADEPEVSHESKLQKWGVRALADPTGAAQENCLRTAVGWANAISNLISPVRKIEIVGTCPVDGCHATHAWTWNEDEWIRNTAITAAGVQAHCGACGTIWAGAELHSLPALMEAAANVTPEMSVANDLVIA
ncbi:MULTISPECIES: hypothetical protein [unclassified Arthrobacter]|uniref:DUF7341 domain-containing protein n=1 Tax=unclassified Arthrobacter TaxID=235627 RepID=UPI001490D97C|nr:MULTISPECIES: hypothetical protein [unclassified Arthrobacter]MBE0009584.1 hypothetical protein [Arthrobacter sp. AET 35A]NOJ63334.1 hypothetical protein [Arthrobacter sp. 147(2020)]